MRLSTILPIVAVIIIVTTLIIVSINDKSPDLAFHPEPIISIAEGSFLRGCESDDICYTPHDVTISKGTTIKWVNDDAEIHTIASGDADKPTGLFDSGIIQSNETFEYTYDKSGNYKYYCTIHPWATGTITVV